MVAAEGDGCNNELKCDIINNKYKYYLPNLMRHNGKVEKDQVVDSDFTFIEKINKKKTVSRKRKKSRKKIYSFNTLL